MIWRYEMLSRVVFNFFSSISSVMNVKFKFYTQELWGDAPVGSTKPGWDPAWADEEDWELVQEELKDGGDPPYAPFYIPYRKPYPPIPDNNFDVSSPKSVIEELDRIEEFLTWVSYIFADGSTYVLSGLCLLWIICVIPQDIS